MEVGWVGLDVRGVVENAPQPGKLELKYRADIDGLRAVAVLSVLAFHFRTPGFGGGFIGVDVFFVISGYLIASSIRNSVASGEFSFLEFYTGRARRLLPALLMTLAISSVFAFLINTPEQFANFGASAASAALFVSNFYFWRHTGYFDPTADSLPLLHTWSLGVEAQFYAIFPILFVVILASRMKWLAPLGLAGVGVASFALTVSLQDGYSHATQWSATLAAAVQDGAATTFYLPIFRAFEFVIGILLLWVPQPQRPTRALDISFLSGIGLIIFSVTTFRNAPVASTANALLPCLGAALCIYSGSLAPSGILVRNRAFAFIGMISYSIYLVHWPLLSLYRQYVFRDPTASERAWLFVASIVAGYLMYNLIEQRFRRPRHNQRIATTITAYASLAINLALVGYIINAQEGWPWRIDQTAQSVVLLNYSKNADFLGSIGCTDFCEFGDLTNPKIIILAGDSHMDQYTKALAALAPTLHFKLIQSGGCYIGDRLTVRPTGWKYRHCRAAEAEMKKWLHNPQVVAVVHAQRWVSYGDLLQTEDGHLLHFSDDASTFDAMIGDILPLYKNFSGRVVFINAAPDTNSECLTRPPYLILGCPTPTLDRYRLLARTLTAAIANKTNMAFVDPSDVLCRNDECIYFANGMPAYSDTMHLTVEAAKLVVPNILLALRHGDKRQRSAINYTRMP